ncbi:hypothetical protein NQZ79_g214 [Umbelopsis isabellina]|nr:hypothetical protein NQZ79_g214 [Umbelopsis isabellina]
MSVTFWPAPSMKRSATVHTELNLKKIEHPKKSPFPCERNDSMIKIVGPKEMSRRPSVKDLASDVYIAASAEKQTKLKKTQSEVTILVNAFLQYVKSVKERKQDMKKVRPVGMSNPMASSQGANYFSSLFRHGLQAKSIHWMMSSNIPLSPKNITL